ncbi:MAG: response regulator [Elusimicrobiota bacterium]|jgi:DNA-binding response OmpR family regulator
MESADVYGPMQPFVLVVEDDADLATILCDSLRHAGYRATHCQDAAQAVIQAQNLRMGAILLDIRLPHFGSGIDVYHCLRGNPHIDRGLPILFMTGLPPEQAVPLIPADPRVRLLIKPLHFDHITKHLHDLCGETLLSKDVVPPNEVRLS